MINLKDVPKKPGVYLWIDKNEQVLYVGKAKNLFSRMNQYFNSKMKNSYKTNNLVKNIYSYKYFLTHSDRDALILERELIAKYLPKYNIRLTDNKHYPYLKIEILKNKLNINLSYKVRQTNNDKVFFFGPFPQGYGARKIVDLFNKLYNYEKGIRIKNPSNEYLEKSFNEIKKILTNKNNSLINELKEKMHLFSENQQYELAQEIKEIIDNFKILSHYQTIEMKNKDDVDVIAFNEYKDLLFITIFFYRQGVFFSQMNQVIDINFSKDLSIKDFIDLFYFNNYQPDYIISNEKFHLDSVKVINPLKGVNKEILNLVTINNTNNLELKYLEYFNKKNINLEAQQKLFDLLKIKNSNNEIAIVDNSHFSNQWVISLILFYKNGIKNTLKSKKYHLKKEEIKRRSDLEYLKLGVEKHFIKNENELPDLLIVDGSIAHIKEAKKILNFDQVIGLSKDAKHQTKYLVDFEYKKIPIKDLDNNLRLFLSNIQIEVDLFAKKEHKKQRLNSLEGELSNVPGIGPALEKKLLNRFKSYANIYNASIEEVSKVIPKNIAINLKKFLGELI